MKRILPILFLLFLSCKTEVYRFQKQLDKSLKLNIGKNKYFFDKKEKNIYLKTTYNFLTLTRKQFLLNIDLRNFEELNLIEHLNFEMPSSLYSAVLKVDSNYYLFNKNSKYETYFKKVDFETLKKERPSVACMILEMDKPSPNKLDGPRISSYHYSIYLTKITKDKKIKFHIPVNLCILDD